MTTEPEAIDHERLLAEIDEEARRRRESGDLPAEFERELDLVFARFSPVHAIGDDFHQVLERAEQSTFIDVLAPTESSMPLVPHVKRIVRKAIIWEVRYVAQQVSAFASATARAVRLLGERVDRLERARPGDGRTGQAERPGPDLAGWEALVVEALAGRPGRVLHADAEDGALVARLGLAGVDAYGVDPVERAAPAGVELRRDDALAHLRALPEGALAGVVLSGCVDRLPLADQRELAELALSRAPGGVVVVLGTDPRAAAAGAADVVAADLAPGRPLHAATWAELLGRAGARSAVAVEVVPGPRPPGLSAVPDVGPELAANLERLDERLFPPASYAVVVRPTS